MHFISLRASVSCRLRAVMRYMPFVFLFYMYGYFPYMYVSVSPAYLWVSFLLGVVGLQPTRAEEAEVIARVRTAMSMTEGLPETLQ